MREWSKERNTVKIKSGKDKAEDGNDCFFLNIQGGKRKWSEGEEVKVDT